MFHWKTLTQLSIEIVLFALVVFKCFILIYFFMLNLNIKTSMIPFDFISLNNLQILSSCRHFMYKQNFEIFFQKTAVVYLNRALYYSNSF